MADTRAGPPAWRRILWVMTTQVDQAQRFLALHRAGEPLLMPNPWDLGSARLLASLGFEALAESSRHKSGLAVRFPRMLRWRKDKPASEADSLDTVRGMLGPKTGIRD